jgi:TATA-binding protein-associated factor
MATAGAILGKLKDFNKKYGKPIQASRCRNASSYDKKQGSKANEELQETLKPYMLRRQKLDFLADELPQKLEMAVWVKPSAQQMKMYKEKIEEKGFLAENILSSDNQVANKAKMSAFQLLAELRNLCGHPLRLLKGGPEGDIRSALEQTDLDKIISGSKKLKLVLHMLKGFKKEDHKALVFSQSTQNLDVIQNVLAKQNTLTICRLDG